MAGARHHFDVFVVRYVPNILEDKAINIGILLADRDEAGFAASRFLRDWRPVKSLDPRADAAVLDSLMSEIRCAWEQPAQRANLLNRMASFSGAIQLHAKGTVVTDKPRRELNRLALDCLNGRRA
jgi:Protein of unknown function (DUF3037)